MESIIKRNEQELKDFYVQFFLHEEELESFLNRVYGMDWNDRIPRQMINQVYRFITLSQKIDENVENTINDINMKSQNFGNENGNLIDKSLYENINNEYLKIKEEFEKYKIEKNTEIEESKINNLQNIEDEKKKLILDFRKKETSYLKDNEEKVKILSDKNIKISELENQIRQLNSLINLSNKKINQYENIIIKQEDNIEKLRSLKTKNDNTLRLKITDNEKKDALILQLENQIKEQKIQIENIKHNQEDRDISEILRLKSEINTLKSTIEVKNESIKTIQKSHKVLQDKYLKMVSERRLKPQRDLLEQAKEMRIRKLERDQNNLSFMINLNKKKKSE